MKLVTLTQGQFAMVDDADFDRVNQFKWYARKSYNTFYATRNISLGAGRQSPRQLHQFILPGVKQIDHKDGNGLNNQKYNLRPATSIQNKRNCRKYRGDFSSKFKGVRKREYNRWQARISIVGRLLNIGSFDSEEQAAKAYDTAAIKHFGEFAKLNFPDSVNIQTLTNES